MSYRTALTFLAVTCSLAGAGTSASAQSGSVRRDPATGDYLVEIRTLDNRTDFVRVPAVNRVRAAVDLTVSATSTGVVRYDYSVRVYRSSPQKLGRFLFPCPVGVSNGEVSATEFRSGVPTTVQLDVGAPRCFGIVGLPAGDSMQVALRSPLLPSITQVGLEGSADVPQWPCECWDLPQNQSASITVDTLSGFRGGWVSVLSLAPVRVPELVGTPQATVLHLQSDLGLVCGPFALITNPGICASLRAKLDAVGEAVARGNAQGARGPLGAFVNELEAQRGKVVSPLAFTLLSFYAQRLGQQLGQ